MNPQVKRLLEDLRNNSDKKTTIYSMSHCPACNQLKGKLDHLGIIYEDIEMEGNDEMWKWLKENGGKEYTPQVNVEGKILNEFEEINDLVGMVISEIVGRRIIIK